MKRLFFLAAGMFVMGCEDYLFAGLLPGISVSLTSSVAAVAQGCTAFGLAYLLSMPLCAFLLSKKTVRQVLLAAFTLSLAGNVMTLISPDLIIYIGSRFVAGLGGGLFLPIAVAAGAQLVESDFRGRALSLMWSFNIAGAVVGVPLGLWLAGQMGWRATVFLIVLLDIFALIGFAIRKEPIRVKAPPPRLAEQFRLLVNPQLLAVIAVTFLMATGALGLYSFITPVLSGTKNSGELAFAFWSVGGLVGSTGIGYVVDRTGKPQLVMAIILTVLLVTFTAIPFLSSISILGLLPFLVWGAMGWASVTPQQYSLIKINANHDAILVALNSSAVSLGSVAGTALAGMALASGLDAKRLPYAASIFIFCAWLAQILLIRFDGRRAALS